MYVVKAKNAADNEWTTIYDSSDKALCLISQPKHSSEMNQPGSFDFTIYPDSDFYGAIVPMNTFISAFEGTDSGNLEETFYGRVLTCEDDFYGIKSVSCEGALSFFKDATVGKVSTDDGDSGREYQTSPQAFLQEQLDAYNAKVEERKKLFYGGTSGITTSDAEIFKIDDDQDFGSILESQLIDVYGGFFKISRLQNGTHELSYVKNYGIDSGTVQTIQIGQNILDKQKHETGEGVFTFIRPVGKDGLRLEDGVYHGVVCNSSNGRSGLYPVGTDEASFNALYARYGFIEKTKSFEDCENTAALANSCNWYVRDYGLDALDKLPMTFDVKLVDFFNANPNVKRIELGANYILTVDSEGRETGFEGHADGTPAQEGQEGLTLTVYSINREYDSPENDSITFHNATYLTAKDYSIILSSMTGSYSGSSGGGGSRGGLSGLMASKDVEEQEKFKRFETFYEETDEKFSWLATDSEWDELSQTRHVTAFTQLTRTAHFVEDTAKKELPFEDWKVQWLIAHPEDASLPETELRAKYKEWIAANPYAIYNTQYSDATRTERIISKTGINALGENETVLSRITQEADRVESFVYASQSQVYSAIEQTASAVSIAVGQRPTTVVQNSHTSGVPTSINGRGLKKNDIWIDTADQTSWDAALSFNWNDDLDYDWNELRSDKIYVYRNGAWQLSVDGTVLAEDTDLQIERDHIALLARNIDTLDGYARENFAQLQVRGNEIYSEVVDRTNNLGSRITQTSTQIRSEVHAANSQIYSEISQTASNILLHVENEISDLGASLEVTAKEIRSDVYAAKSSFYSSISQTASQIALKVGKGDVATQLAVEVGNVTITNGNLVVDGYVTAGEFSGETAKFTNLVSGNTQATKLWAVDIKANNVEIGSGTSGTLKYHGTNVTTRNALSVDGTKKFQVLGLGLDDTDSGLDELSGAFNGCSINANNGQVKFTFYKLGGGYIERNFNIADTQYFRDAVSAARPHSVSNISLSSSSFGSTVSKLITVYCNDDEEYDLYTNVTVPSPSVNLSVHGIWIEADGTENDEGALTQDFELWAGEKMYVRAANNGTLGGTGVNIIAARPTLTFSWVYNTIGTRFRVNMNNEDSGLSAYLEYDRDSGNVYVRDWETDYEYAKLFVGY